MKGSEYFRTMAGLWNDEVVVCALGTNANEWWNLTQSAGTFYMHAAMGFASSFALGLALSLPNQNVWLLDSDGGLSMNLGGLLTEASLQPANLKHFVLSNRCYQSLGGAKLVNSERTDYVLIARGAGIPNGVRVDTTVALKDAVRSAGRTRKYALVVAEVEPEPQERLHERPPSLPYEGPEIKYKFGRYIEEKIGIAIFGPEGY